MSGAVTAASVVALLVIAGLLAWVRSLQRQLEEARRLATMRKPL